MGSPEIALMIEEESPPKRPIRVCISGISGWTGSAVATAAAAASDIELVAGVARRATDIELGTPIFASVDAALDAVPTDVLVDYTHPSVVKSHVLHALAERVAVVVGTSGLSDKDYKEIETVAEARGVGVVAAGNFSLFAALLLRFAAEAAPHAEGCEILDFAGAQKPDAPSGTAREIAERLGQQTRQETPETTVGAIEARGARIAGRPVHSVRIAGFALSTEVVFGSPGERFTLRHDAGDSAGIYVAGTLLAVRAVVHRVGLTRGLDRLLFA
jgi:4-hydroxy-tetrahydrodipicolinate reductase